jgi:hypothetical protein
MKAISESPVFFLTGQKRTKKPPRNPWFPDPPSFIQGFFGVATIHGLSTGYQARPSEADRCDCSLNQSVAVVFRDSGRRFEATMGFRFFKLTANG